VARDGIKERARVEAKGVAMQPIAEWLDKFGLGHYAKCFARTALISRISVISPIRISK
jgi:hypothetical protein